MPPLQPELPELMIIARKLGVHVSALAPFLDTLPAPFSWRLETPYVQRLLHPRAVVTR